MASYAKVNRYGFIETPFQKVLNTVVNDGVSPVNRITSETISDEKGKVIVEEKETITEEIAKRLKDEYPNPVIPVRAFVVDEYEYFDAYQERALTIAEANVDLDKDGNFKETRIGARRNAEPVVAFVKEVTHKDVSPKQIMSETTTLVPFLEHDDATRAEMGTNMMRQAVPLIRTDSPVV